MAILLTRADIASLLDEDDALAAAEAAFRALAREEVVLPQRIAVPVAGHGGTHLSMPCYARTPEREVLCTKIVTVFERNPERGLPTTMAYLTLQDPGTGTLLALMDAEYLTGLRTAAASALAVRLLAPEDADTMALFGIGGQAEFHLRALPRVRPIRRIYVVARSLERATAFCQEHGDVGELIPTEDRETAIRESQVICSVTNSTEPLFQGSWLRPRATIVAVGAFRPDMREVDRETVRRSIVVVDRLAAAQQGAGDLIQGGADWESVHCLGDLLVAANTIPQNERPRLFKSVGLAAQDAFIAALAYERALGSGTGQPIELH